MFGWFKKKETESNYIDMRNEYKVEFCVKHEKWFSWVRPYGKTTYSVLGSHHTKDEAVAKCSQHALLGLREEEIYLGKLPPLNEKELS